jgi:hypothetical protein
MLKYTSQKKSKDINKLAAYIVDAITQKESATKLINEKNAITVALKRLWGFKDDRSRAEKNSAKIRGKIALKAAMERCSKSSKIATTVLHLYGLEKHD